MNIPRIVTPSPAGIHLPLFNHFSTSRSVHEEQQEACKEEEDGVHNTKRKARLQHCASLVDAPCEGAISIEAIRSQGHVKVRVKPKARAVCVGNAAQLVDAGDECAHKAEVYE